MFVEWVTIHTSDGPRCAPNQGQNLPELQLQERTTAHEQTHSVCYHSQENFPPPMPLYTP